MVQLVPLSIFINNVQCSKSSFPIVFTKLYIKKKSKIKEILEFLTIKYQCTIIFFSVIIINAPTYMESWTQIIQFIIDMCLQINLKTKQKTNISRR